MSSLRRWSLDVVGRTVEVRAAAALHAATPGALDGRADKSTPLDPRR